MIIKKFAVKIAVVALSLATAWAIRGQFGHEQGAAWAGAIGALAIVVVSKRKDWYFKMVPIALASAMGWGAGGMISYGQVVGYGKADNFINVFYGLGMLFVIGALFGLLGGGLVGLVLEESKKTKVNWGGLVSEMVAGALLTYFFLIEQIGFKMTPPRSEAWALILGAGIAMLLHMARSNRNSAIRVAIFSALGGGFGFSFGNFLQVTGNVFEIPFNMWNVMEYSIGFFGGTGMAYGVFSSKWPVDDEGKPRAWVNMLSLLVLLVFIPLMIYRESLAYAHILNRLGGIPDIEQIALTSALASAIVLSLMAISVFWKLKNGSYGTKDAGFFLFVYLGVYALLSYVVTGLFAGKLDLNHHLYLMNILIIYIMVRKEKVAFPNVGSKALPAKKWVRCFLAILVLIAILSLVAINIHNELPGSYNRFE